MWLQMAACDVELSGDDVAESLANHGLVMIREAGAGEVRDLLARWAVPVRHPHEREPGLTIVSPRSGSAVRFAAVLSHLPGDRGPDER